MTGGAQNFFWGTWRLGLACGIMEKNTEGVIFMEGYKHILVPLDGSSCSERALVEAERLQAAFDAKLTLLYVVSDPDFDCAMGNPTVASANVQRDCDEAEKYLARKIEDYSGKAEAKVVVGCVANSILAAAEKLDCDLVIMGSQGLGSALRRFLVGSVAKNVLANAKMPVMIVH